MKNKKAQTSETITWIVALLIIIFILGSSIFLSSQIAKIKKHISVGELNLNSVSKNDLALQQAVFSLFQKEDSEREGIMNNLKKLNSEKKFRGNLDAEINKLSKNLE